MDKFITKQNELFNQIHKLGVNLKKSPKPRLTQGYLETRLESLENYWDKFMNGHDSITKIVTAEHASISYFEKNVYNECEEEYFEIKGTLKDNLLLILSTNVSQSTSQHEQNTEAVRDIKIQTKLPPIHMPKFNGNYSDWVAFNDLYCSLIHKNDSLGDVQKFHYLKSCLVGEAEQLIKHYSLTEANYKKAWEHLKSRYHNKRSIVNAQLTKLLTQRKLQFESTHKIRELLDTTSECLHALDNLEVDTSSWDAIIVYLTVSKLDPESHKLWEQLLGSSTELPTFERLREYLETRFRTLEVLHPGKEVVKRNAQSFSTNIATTTNAKCAYCSELHYICHCKEFAKLEIHNRREYVKQKGLCFNCLIPGHSVAVCKQMTTCRKCSRKHHSLLHVNHQTIKAQTITTTCTEHPLQSLEEYTPQVPTTYTALKTEIRGCKVLLVTALVLAKSRDGTTHTLRALIDQGSQASFITESASQLLGLRRTRIQGHVTGINSTKTMQTRSMIESLVLTSLDKEYNISVDAYVLNTLTTILPAHNIICSWPQISKLKLADPTYSTPGRIDLLLGAEVYSRILLDGLHKSPQASIIAQNSHLGWLLSGKIDDHRPSCNTIVIMHSRLEVDETLRKFWEVEDLPTTERTQTMAEIKCEEFYVSTTQRTSEGQYIVRLPFIHDNPSSHFGGTRTRAINRLHQMENRFKRQPELKMAYTDFLKTYHELGHMTLVPSNDYSNSKAYYLPHHAVLKECSSTTKLRVVFDGSAKSSNNVSLNELLLVGPMLQQDIRNVILRWRRHKICFVADIKMMYRQILIDDADANYQRIVWRSHETDEIKEYKLRTVTYGTSSAPYLAIRTLHQLAEDEQDKFPKAAAIIKTDFYVDDLMSGCSSEEEAINVSKQLMILLQKGGFELRKWTSNNRRFLETIPPDYREHSESHEIGMENAIKALGITWNPNTDNFELKPYFRTTYNHPMTKRSVLSDIASMFDPLGWLAPTIVLAKIILQKLWLAGLDWDEALPSQLAGEWVTYRTELVQMEKIKLTRWIGIDGIHNRVELHGFSDASCMAYSAVVYARVIKTDGSIHVSLVAAKTKVAPVKQISLPRLELCGAVLLAKLLSHMRLCLNIPDHCVVAWTDSTIVLAWLQSHPNRWKTFIANRVTEILNRLNNTQWNHVKSEENPADCASRGIYPSLLQSHSLWWTGPPWLCTQDIPFGKCHIIETNLECKVYIISDSVNSIYEPLEFLKRFSSLMKLLRVTAFCLRFVKNCRLKLTMRRNKLVINEKDVRCSHTIHITVHDIETALSICIKIAQNLNFSEELSQLSRQLDVKSKSNLLSLNPILDHNGIMRVGGRLRHANISESMRHPIILSHASPLSKLIVSDAHIRTLHGGPQLMLNFIRSKYWILGIKNLVKKHVHSCIICFKRSARPSNQLMGDLPKSRVTPAKPFSSCGVDFAGPFLIRPSKGRGTKTSKGYISLFICTVTKAIHLEAVSDLSSEGFIAAFKRLVARRGHCSELWSDCGTNFVGASKELDRMFKNTTSPLTIEIANLLVNDGTAWHFIPPGTPHFGGLWEAGVKSVKYHLRRILGDTKLTYEEFSTILPQIEACLNSRPLTSLSNHPQDLNPLTPGHFLIGEPLILIPEKNFLDTHSTRLSRWQLIQKLTQDFWHRWSKEYLPTLQQRTKWKTRKPEVDVGDLVLVKDERLPPGKWLLGRIITKHPGADGITRVVSLQCKNSIIRRPLVKLCPLPLENSLCKD